MKKITKISKNGGKIIKIHSSLAKNLLKNMCPKMMKMKRKQARLLEDTNPPMIWLSIWILILHQRKGYWKMLQKMLMLVHLIIKNTGRIACGRFFHQSFSHLMAMNQKNSLNKLNIMILDWGRTKLTVINISKVIIFLGWYVKIRIINAVVPLIKILLKKKHLKKARTNPKSILAWLALTRAFFFFLSEEELILITPNSQCL